MGGWGAGSVHAVLHISPLRFKLHAAISDTTQGSDLTVLVQHRIRTSVSQSPCLAHQIAERYCKYLDGSCSCCIADALLACEELGSCAGLM